MYHPYFRGKQYELIAIRETAAKMAALGFVPVIEPVNEALGGLERALDAICEAKGNAIVIVNPKHGDHADDGSGITALLKKGYLTKPNISAGILLKAADTLESAAACYKAHKEHTPTFVHASFTHPKDLAQFLGANLAATRHVFFEDCGKLYHRHFKGSTRVLMRDGFTREVRNADYPGVDRFSDLHVTFQEEGMNGFGDFLMVGDDFSEGGGPAYAVAIHLTFIDPARENVMFIYHFVSTTRDTPTDPAGKFGQALTKLIEKLDSGTSNLFESDAIQEFRELHAKGHFPGLGYVKKLSMKHHIETMAAFFGT